MDEATELLASLTQYEVLLSAVLHVVVIALVPVVLLLIFTTSRVSTQLALYFADSWSLKRLPRYKDPFGAWKMMWNTINWTNFCEKMRRKDGNFHPMLNCGPSSEGRHWVAISDPELVKSVLMQPEPDEETTGLYAKLRIASPTFADAYTAWIGESLLSSQGSKWHIHRKASTPLFFYTVLQDQLPFISRSAYDLVRSIRTQNATDVSGSPTKRVSAHVMRCLLHLIAGPEVVQEASSHIAKHSVDWMIEQQHNLVQHFRSSLQKTSFIGGRMWHFLGGRVSSMLPWLGGEGNLHDLQEQRYHLACYCQSLINRLRYEEEEDAEDGHARSSDLLSMLFYMKLDEDFAIHQQLLSKTNSKSSATSAASLGTTSHTPTPPLPSRRSILKRSHSSLRRSSASLVVTPPLSPSESDSNFDRSESSSSLSERPRAFVDNVIDITPTLPAKFSHHGGDHDHSTAQDGDSKVPKLPVRRAAVDSPDFSPILAPAPYQSDAQHAHISKLKNWRISAKSTSSLNPKVRADSGISPPKSARTTSSSSISASSSSISASTTTTASSEAAGESSIESIVRIARDEPRKLPSRGTKPSRRSKSRSESSPSASASAGAEAPPSPPLSFLDDKQDSPHSGKHTYDDSEASDDESTDHTAADVLQAETKSTDQTLNKSVEHSDASDRDADDGEDDSASNRTSGSYSSGSLSGSERSDHGWETSSDGSANEEDDRAASGPNPALSTQNWATMPYKDDGSSEEDEEDDANNVPGSQPHRPGHLPDETIIDHGLAFLSAGFQSTVSTIEWCLYHLAQDPQIVRKLQEEVHLVLDGHIPSTVSQPSPRSPRCEDYSSVPKRMMGEIGRAGSGLGLGDLLITPAQYNKLGKVRNFVKEVLRFHPTQPVVERITTDKVKLGGHTIPEGTAIGLMVWNLHHSPNLWKDPERFWPERFEKENEDDKDSTKLRGGPSHSHAYIPFAAGHHSCIAQKYANYVLVSTVALLVRAFDFELAGDAPVRESFYDGVLSPENLNIRFQPRDLAPSSAPLMTTVQALKRTISRGSQLVIKTPKTEESSAPPKTSTASSSPTVSRRVKPIVHA